MRLWPGRRHWRRCSARRPRRPTPSSTYSAPENAYGWCAGYDLRTAHRCAYRQCASYGSRCVAVVECGGGWGATAIAQDPYCGFAGVCGMGDAFSARGWALTNCMATANTLCSTRFTFDARGATASNRDNSLFDTTWLVQAMLQMRKYDPGNADGVLGERTRAAIRKFQQTIGMAETGDPYAVLNPLIDAMGGVGILVAAVDRSVVKPRRQQEIRGYTYAPKPAPKRTMGAELMELSADRRLTALAVSLQARGPNCGVPARDAQLVHDSLDRAVWSITCTGGRSYTFIINADGSSMVMAGGKVEVDLPSDDRSGESAPGPGTNDNRSRTARPGN